MSHIQIQGNDRIKAETIHSYLNFAPGQVLYPELQRNIVYTLYQSMLFSDIELLREEDTLIIRVQERPAIASITFDGNVLLKTADIEAALEQTGLVKGRIYNKNVLEKLEAELERIYYSQGKYGVKIEIDVKHIEDNRVDIDIQIQEGFPAKIVRVNIIGNQAFSDDVLEQELKTGIPAWWAVFSSRDEYSKPKLEGDLEVLRSWYLDRGYLKFSITSTQVTLSPDKEDLYININIEEGEQYRVSETKLAGNLVIDVEELQQLLLIKPGEPFSRKKIQQVTTLLKQRLGNEGYARVKVNVIPEINEQENTVALTFNIDPGRRFIVRNIEFKGNYDTFDEVLRRELRQMQGAWYDASKIERGRVRIQRLSYIAQVSVQIQDVPGSYDELNIRYQLEERLSGSINLGAGFSDDGLLFNFGVTKDNLFGTGNSLSLDLNRSGVTEAVSVSYRNPYYTIDGVSRGFSFFYRKTDATESNASDYILDRLGASMTYGVPLSEYSRLRFGLTVEDATLTATDGSPLEVDAFLAEHGPDYMTFSPSMLYTYDTRNRTIFAEKGSRHSVSLEFSVPGSELEFFKSDYQASYHFPVTERTVFLFKHEISYGDGYGGDLKELPPYEKYTAGGIRSVRGFRSRSLTSDPNTIDSENTAYGGDFRVAGTFEYVLPPPGDNYSVRFSLFYDIGNVFSDYNEFDADQLRSSAGIALNWLTPIGALTFSYAEPIESERGDDTQRFQFNIGGSF